MISVMPRLETKKPHRAIAAGPHFNKSALFHRNVLRGGLFRLFGLRQRQFQYPVVIAGVDLVLVHPVGERKASGERGIAVFLPGIPVFFLLRSEERRVGKECVYGW